MTRRERAPTADRLAAIGEAILRERPEPFRSAVAHLPIRVSDWADDAILDAMGIEDPLELTGLYAGVPIGERLGLALPPSQPEMIHLYRLPILFEWCERGCGLQEVVFDELTHEIGHHFGMDEASVLRMEDRHDEL
ncbi:MAG: metallopeptidase family protein, partial [Geminicoccaceae bacterium]